ncbi:uncharacterized protein PG998_005145 [Apiospora kogelbergensis]|uniref:uncharacterized protein n=1 Tax=Apiospora kogelbergensis TaxID=1337665 RepID=UPI00312F81C9
MATHTGIFTSAVSVESFVVASTDINGFASTITTKSVAAAILSWMPDGNYTYLTHTYLPFRTDTNQGLIATTTEAVTSTTHLSSPVESSTIPAGLGGGAIAGIVVGSLVGIAILAALCWLVFRHRRRALGASSHHQSLNRQVLDHQPPQESAVSHRCQDGRILTGQSDRLWEEQQKHGNRGEDRYELEEPDHIPQTRQQRFEKPELDAATPEVLNR